MSQRRYEITDHEWSIIEPLLPNKPRGVPRVDDRKVLNFSLTYQKDTWDAQLFSNNVSDEVYIEGHSNGGDGIFYGDPRVIGFRVRKQF